MKKIIGISELLETVAPLTLGAPLAVRRPCGARRRRRLPDPRASVMAASTGTGFAEVLRRWTWHPVEPMTRRDPSARDLEWLEAELGASLPAEYRGFLCTHGWTRFSDAMTFALGEAAPWGTGARIASFLGFSSDIRRDLGFLVSEAGEGAFPEGTIPIATDRRENAVLLGVTGAGRGRVWFWDRECRGLDRVIDEMVRDLERVGIEILDEDERQIVARWEATFPQRRTRPRGFTGVYAVADSFARFVASLGA